MSTDWTMWDSNNERYLSAALAWLRLRLAQLAGPTEGSSTGVEVEFTPATSPSTARRWFRRESEPAPSVALPSPAAETASEDVDAAASAMHEAEQLDPPPAMMLLSQRFGLSRFEQELLLLCAGLELDTRIAALCARAQDDPSKPYPTFALAMVLFGDPTWDALSPERPLRYWRLIEINQPGAQPLTTSALRADERIVSYLKGLNYLDDRLAPLLVPFDAAPGGEGELPGSQQRVVDAIHAYATRVDARAPVIQLVGADPLSQQLVAQQVAERLGVGLYRLPAELLPSAAADVETLVRLWQRESALMPVALYVDAHEGGETGEGAAPPLHRFLGRGAGLTFVGTREPLPALGRPGTTVDVDKPTPEEQRVAWHAALGEGAGDVPTRLAMQFDLNEATIQELARGIDADDGARPAALWEACLQRTRPRLDRLAQRIHPVATWDDIVLPPDQMTLLRQIAGQVGQRSRVYDEWGFRERMNRGLGISALFAGESGTGKTMAAEVLANALRLNLDRIDLSAVVSKYIGETEKNLRRLFDAAEDGGVILFFDEADALFGKRSEVKDSHDRYANIEINYLLQRMEAFGGLAILATNMKRALDQAFLRRLRFIVNFPFPGVEERRVIWEKAFPPGVPLGELEIDRLARLNLAGGSIHNVALNAAFLAAAASEPVGMGLVLDAARAEFRKLERPVNDALFRHGE